MTEAPSLIYAPKPFKKVAFISDAHFPYQHRKNVLAVLEFLADYRPDLTYLGGDIVDNYLPSDHDKDPGRRLTLQDEIDSAQPFFKAVDEVSRAVVYQAGNHEERLDRVIRANPGLYTLRALQFKKAAELPGRWIYYPDQTHLRLGKLLFLHGNLKNRGGGTSRHIAANVLSKLRTSCVFGHYHRFDRAYATDYEGHVQCAFANGHLSDVEQAKYITAPDWQAGFTAIEFNHEHGIFHVDQFLMVDGWFQTLGKAYRPRAA